MAGSSSGNFLSADPFSVGNSVFLSDRFLFLGKVRNRIGLNQETNMNIIRLKPLFRQKSRKSEAMCGMACCRDSFHLQIMD